MPPVAADALPRLFAEGRELDVDLDGRPDRVREIALLPRHSPDPTLPAVVLVAHALPDGRFALDDDISRAALRALCPEDPTLTYRRVEHEEETAQGERLNALLLDAYCQQAWGRELADLTANLRSLQHTVGTDVLRTDQIEAIAQVLREFAPPITLEPLRAATLPTFPSRTDASAASGARAQDVDGDGRPDVTLPSPWHVVEGCGSEPVEVEGPTLLAHALPDGRFSTDDEVARGWLTRQCEEALREGVSVTAEGAASLVTIACARRAGASAEGVVAALRARHRDAPRVRLPGVVSGDCVAFHDLAINALIAR